MPRAKPFTQAKIERRAQAPDLSPRVTVEMIAGLRDMHGLPPADRENITARVNQALQWHWIHDRADHEETPAAILAALVPVADKFNGFLNALIELPLSLRQELAIDEAALLLGLDNAKILIGRYELQRESGGYGTRKDIQRASLADNLLEILACFRQEVAADRQKATRWIADIQRATGLVTPDETKNPKRLLGRPSRIGRVMSGSSGSPK